MSLDKDRLGDDMADKVLALMPSSPVAADEAGLRTLMKAIAEAIVDEIQTNSEVPPGSFVDAEARPIVGTGGPVT